MSDAVAASATFDSDRLARLGTRGAGAPRWRVAGLIVGFPPDARLVRARSPNQRRACTTGAFGGNGACVERARTTDPATFAPRPRLVRTLRAFDGNQLRGGAVSLRRHSGESYPGCLGHMTLERACERNEANRRAWRGRSRDASRCQLPGEWNLRRRPAEPPYRSPGRRPTTHHAAGNTTAASTSFRTSPITNGKNPFSRVVIGSRCATTASHGSAIT